MNALLDALGMPRFVDIMEFLDGRFECESSRFPVRMFTDFNGNCHAYMVSYKGR